MLYEIKEFCATLTDTVSVSPTDSTITPNDTLIDTIPPEETL